MTQTKNLIRNIYLYLVSAISLFMIVFSLVSMVNLALRTWVFPQADYNYYQTAPVAIPCTPDPTNKITCPTAEQQATQKALDDKNAEQNRIAQRDRDLVQEISFLIIAIPLFWYHWLLIRRDREEA